MAPDLNSLPPSNNDLQTPSRTTTIMASSSSNNNSNGESSPMPMSRSNGGNNNGSDVSPSPSPRSASVSLQAAATLNAGLHRGEPLRSTSQPIPFPALPRHPTLPLRLATTATAGIDSPLSRSGSSSSSMSRGNRQSPSAGRRRSQVLMNLQLADPTVPAPGEMVSSEPHHPIAVSGVRTSSPQLLPGSSPVLVPHHIRTPSLGELHQELENEQEFHVNRLLAEITRLQAQLAQRQPAGGPQQQQNSSAVVTGDEPNDRSMPLGISSAPQSAAVPQAQFGSSVPRSPVFTHPRSSFDMARADLHRRSRTPSRGASPRLRSTSFSTESGEQWILGGRDESAFYQAETQMLVRENQMLKHRIRELERQLSELTGTVANTSITHEPSQHSHLTRSTSVSEDDYVRVNASTSTTTASLPTVTDTPKEE